jgi:hypothetical protein
VEKAAQKAKGEKSDGDGDEGIEKTTPALGARALRPLKEVR